MKKQSNTKQAGAHTPEAKRPKRKKTGWIVFGVLLVAVALVLAYLPTIAERSQETPRSIASAQAQPATIEDNLRSAGTLLDEDASYISILEGVKYEFVKENGDLVSPGELIATTDPTSVMLTIAELQTAMEELDEKIEDARDGSSSSTVTTPADGRVKAIYAEVGQDVSEAMYENGALMLLSLDGKMAVDVAASSVSAGQAITVEFNDGSTMDGRVSTISGTRATVTLSDNGPAPGEAVALRDENGDLIGSGSLYIHSELKITGYYGTVDSLSVSLGEYVYVGDTLLSLSIEDSSAAYAGLLAQRQEMERQMQTLFQLYQDGGIYASEGGFLAELVEYTDPEDSQSQSQNNAMGGMPFGLAADSEQPQLMLLAETDELPLSPVGSGAILSSLLPEETEVIPEPEAPDSETPTPTPETSPASDSGNADADGGSSEDPAPSVSPAPDDSGSTPGPISTAAFVDRYAKVVAVTDTSLELRMAPQETTGIHYADRDSLAKLEYATENSIYLSTLTGKTVLTYTPGSSEPWSLGAVSDLQSGDYVILTYAGSHPTAALFWLVCHPAQSSSVEGGKPEGGKPDMNIPDDPKPDMGDSGSEPSTPSDTDSSSSGEMSSSTSSMSGMTGMTGMSGMTGMTGMTMPEGLQMAQEEKYTLNELQICAITPDNNMSVELSIDELDILDITEGQAVTLHLDALNQDFIGSIEEIAAEATNNGGSPKFLVTVSLLRDLDMRTGMNAAASILLSQVEALCSLPAEAIVELDGRSYVYTGYDEKDDVLLDPVAVVTGLSDGQTVEILSGLEAGVMVYYEYQGSLISPLFD